MERRSHRHRWYAAREAERNLDRKRAELIDKAERYYADADTSVTYADSRNLTGTPNDRMRNHKASPNCWEYRSTIVNGHVRKVGKIRTVGGDIKVTKHGISTIIPANELRDAKRKRGETDSEQRRNEQIAQRERLLRNAGLAREW